MLLPTFAGYQETWCGGDNVYLSPTFSDNVVYHNGVAVGAATVSFTYEALLTHSSLCTFQGNFPQSIIHNITLCGTFTSNTSHHDSGHVAVWLPFKHILVGYGGFQHGHRGKCPPYSFKKKKQTN